MSRSAATQCSTQLPFPFFENGELVATSDAGDVVTDPGLLLIREFDERIGFIAAITKHLPDSRDPFRIRHSTQELFRQRIYQIVAGYEDCNDATVLRHDSIFKVIAGRTPTDPPLASQPTLSRFENRVHHDILREMNEELVRRFIDTRDEIPTQLILDVDSTDADTYGQQELAFFSGYYDQYIYHPLLVHDAHTGYTLSVVLRPGNAGGASELLAVLSYIVPLLRAAWPKVTIFFRADSGFCEPNVLSWLEDEQILYTLGIGSNSVLEGLSANFVHAVEKGYEYTRQAQKCYTSIRYAAGKWSHSRRIIVKCEVTALGTNVRYVVTTLGKPSRTTYEWYTERGGTSEDYIEELKNGFEGDRLSCRKFDANFFRLLEHTAAYNLIVLFREKTRVPEIQHATIQTIRRKLIKVGALVKQTARRVWVRMSSTWPFTPIFLAVHQAVLQIPSG
jgi:hypothetical protein